LLLLRERGTRTGRRVTAFSLAKARPLKLISFYNHSAFSSTHFQLWHAFYDLSVTTLEEYRFYGQSALHMLLIPLPGKSICEEIYATLYWPRWKRCSMPSQCCLSSTHPSFYELNRVLYDHCYCYKNCLGGRVRCR